VSSCSVNIKLVHRGTRLITKVWVYSSQALAKLSGLPNLLLEHAACCGHQGAVLYLGITAHLDSF